MGGMILECDAWYSYVRGGWKGEDHKFEMKLEFVLILIRILTCLQSHDWKTLKASLLRKVRILHHFQMRVHFLRTLRATIQQVAVTREAQPILSRNLHPGRWIFFRLTQPPVALAKIYTKRSKTISSLQWIFPSFLFTFIRAEGLGATVVFEPTNRF